MTRVTFFALLAAGVLSALSRADVAVAPPPREIRPDGTRDPVPVAEVPKKEDPREVVERIIKNSKDVGDKLAMTDTGTDTRKTQDRILKDIDALLNQDDPPPKSDQDKDKDKDKDKNPDMNKDKDKDKEPKDKDKEPKDKDKEPKDKDMKGGMGDPPPPKMMDNEPMGGMGNGMEQPMGGDQPKERRPRQGDNSAKEEPKDPGMKEPGSGGKQPKPDVKAGKPKDSKTGGKLPDPMGDKPQPPGTPVLPFEDDTPKEAWGHLPDKLRQQATQYYKQEFMPRYAELLKHYYSSDKK
jgi:hypothetical protein